ncbi:MAG: DUF72 domain-containing protein [Ginsengibacter sp.]
MEFGSIPTTQIKKTDFTLPKTPVFAEAVLKKSKPVNKPLIYVGCSKWGRKEWVGKIYPLKTKEADFLKEYVKHFNSLELNATHYKFPAPEVIKSWEEIIEGQDFKFCPKIYKGISHFSDLATPKVHRQTSDFINAVSGFGENLGPVFLQLSDRFGPSRKEKLFAYLASLPKYLQFFLELRSADWFADKKINAELLNEMKKHNIGMVITDTSGRRDLVHMQLTVPKTFIRFVGNNLHPTDYTRIDEWISRLETWMKKGLQEFYFFMHHTEERNSPELCDYAIDQMNKRWKMSMKRPAFIKMEKPKRKSG